jgi:hypothetical protein
VALATLGDRIFRKFQEAAERYHLDVRQLAVANFLLDFGAWSARDLKVS